MRKKIEIRATLSENVNIRFRLSTRAYHIIHRNNDYKKFPVIINNFNRLEWLEKQIDWLRGAGQNNIHIIDNKSDYGPLLKYYKKVRATVYHLDKNMGHEALWRTHIFQRLGKYYHVYTDPDVLPDADTPNDFMSYFMDKLNRYPKIQKIGFGLRYDDLPDHFSQKEAVVKWESTFYNLPVEPGVFKAPIDTTFALYRPGAAFQCWDQTLRTGQPYMLKHMPWYENSNALSEESAHYLQVASSASSWYEKHKLKATPD